MKIYLENLTPLDKNMANQQTFKYNTMDSSQSVDFLVLSNGVFNVVDKFISLGIESRS